VALINQKPQSLSITLKEGQDQNCISTFSHNNAWEIAKEMWLSYTSLRPQTSNTGVLRRRGSGQTPGWSPTRSQPNIGKFEKVNTLTNTGGVMASAWIMWCSMQLDTLRNAATICAYDTKVAQKQTILNFDSPLVMQLTVVFRKCIHSYNWIIHSTHTTTNALTTLFRATGYKHHVL
jgi:hypothetical protein